MSTWCGRWFWWTLFCIVLSECATAPPSDQPFSNFFVSGTAPIGLAYSPDGRWLVGVRPFYNDVQVFDAQSMKVRHSLKGQAPRSSIVFAAVAFARDGSSAAIAGLDDELSVWDTSTWTEIRRFGGSKGVTGAVVLDRGRQIACVDPDRFVRLWDIDSGAELAGIDGHEALSVSALLGDYTKKLKRIV
jgi:WD40 repeat protein